MKTHIAFFRTEAFALAQAFCDEHAKCLMFQGYDGGQLLNEIEAVGSENDTVAVWRDDVRLRLGARDLYEALPSTGRKIATLRRSPCGRRSHCAGDVRRLLR
jgi:hypothetical protein